MFMPVSHGERTSEAGRSRKPASARSRRPPLRSLLITVLLLSMGLIIVTGINYRTAVRVAEETLRNQGTDISLELAAEARSQGTRDAAALQALLGGQHRREVAFLAVIDRDGSVLAHTNPRLVGSQITDPAFRKVVQSGQLAGEMVTLGTGEEVYELTVPFHVPPPGMGRFDSQQPRFRVLRLALHTHPARQIVYHALIEVVLVGVVVLLLLGLSLWQVRTIRQYLHLQTEAARQERLAALGGMAAVLAHEIRNPLGAIKGLAQFLTEKLTDHPKHSEMTQTIAKEATRLERLVNDLLTYARPRPPKRLSMDLLDSLRHVLALVRPAAEQAGVDLRLQAPDEGVPVHADAEQLQQLFSNLLLNSLQGMPAGGTLTVRVARQEGGAGEAVNGISRGGGGSGTGTVAVRVADTGAGISETDVSRIFEPFYTTRTQGSGLGLPICRQIVEAHGGAIRVERTGPQGTTMMVHLPIEGADG
jgi:two-component system, NtrC family, sensor histidine kinase HydH